MLERARALLRARDPAGAIAVYREILASSTDAERAPIQAEMGEVLLWKMGDRDEARLVLEAALSSEDPEATPRAAGALGVMSAQDGDYDAACALLQRAATSEHPRWAQRALVNLGKLHFNEGYPRAARESLLEVLDVGGPFIPDAISLLALLTDFSSVDESADVAAHGLRFRVEYDPSAWVWGRGDSAGANAGQAREDPFLYFGAVPPGYGDNPPRGAWQMVCEDTEHALLAIGPPRAGKTAGVIVPNVLAWRGPVVSASVTTDVTEATLDARSRAGVCWHFDPSAANPLGEMISPIRGLEMPKPPVRLLHWSPLTGCTDWTRANRIADALTAAGMEPDEQRGTFRIERAAALLGPLLHAAAIGGLRMRDVARWTRYANLQDALEILVHAAGSENVGAEIAADTLRGLSGDRELATHWSSVGGVLRAYRDPNALAMADETNFDIEAFCRSRDTIYITAIDSDQAAVAPIIVAFLRAVREELFAAGLEHSEPAMLWALDGIAHIAPIPDLRDLVSVAGGQHLLIVASIQDLSQARSRWGQEADGFLTLFHTKLVLDGVGDTDTLQRLSRLAGEKVVERRTKSTGSDGVPLESVTSERVPKLPEDLLANPGRQAAWRFIGARWSEQTGKVWLPPYYATSPWCDMAIGPDKHAACLVAAWAVAEEARAELLEGLVEAATHADSIDNFQRTVEEEGGQPSGFFHEALDGARKGRQPARLAIAAYLAIVQGQVTLTDYANASGIAIETAFEDYYNQWGDDRFPMIIPLGAPMVLPGGIVFTQRMAQYAAPEPVKVDPDTALTWVLTVNVGLLQRLSRRETETGEPRSGGRAKLADSATADDPMSTTVILFVEKAAEHERPAAKLAELGPLSEHAVHLAALMLGADVTESDPSAVW
jgi:hypothetical protein